MHLVQYSLQTGKCSCWLEQTTFDVFLSNPVLYSLFTMPNYYTKAHLKTVVLFLKILICIGVWWWWWCSCSVMSDSVDFWSCQSWGSRRHPQLLLGCMPWHLTHDAILRECQKWAVTPQETVGVLGGHFLKAVVDMCAPTCSPRRLMLQWP